MLRPCAVPYLEISKCSCYKGTDRAGQPSTRYESGDRTTCKIQVGGTHWRPQEALLSHVVDHEPPNGREALNLVSFFERTIILACKSL